MLIPTIKIAVFEKQIKNKNTKKITQMPCLFPAVQTSKNFSMLLVFVVLVTNKFCFFYYTMKIKTLLSLNFLLTCWTLFYSLIRLLGLIYVSPILSLWT